MTLVYLHIHFKFQEHDLFWPDVLCTCTLCQNAKSKIFLLPSTSSFCCSSVADGSVFSYEDWKVKTLLVFSAFQLNHVCPIYYSAQNVWNSQNWRHLSNAMTHSLTEFSHKSEILIFLFFATADMRRCRKHTHT